MLPFLTTPVFRLYFQNSPCARCRRMFAFSHIIYSLDTKYSDEQRDKIIDVLNKSDKQALSSYDITKGRIKQFSKWKDNNGILKTLSDVELIDGFTEKSAKKLFDSILEGSVATEQIVSNKIKGQILQPNLSSSDVQKIKTVLTVYITVNSVSWALINKENYEVKDWTYHSIDYPQGRKFQITDILDIAWSLTRRLPAADVYVMKAEATTLRAAGSDPNNPKVLAVNLQKAQMVAMIVALINARDYQMNSNEERTETNRLKQKVYFLRPTLPYRLYGTLVGNEKVSTDQTVEMLLQAETSKNHVQISEELKNMFRSQNDLQKDMLGHCLLLSLTFMDLCIYKDQERIAKLLRKRE